MIEDSFTYAEADVETRLLIETRNEADTCSRTWPARCGQGAALVSAEERTAIEAAVEGPASAREGQDRDAIRDRTTELNHATERLAEDADDSALKGALGTRRAEEIMQSKGDPAAAGET
jgi:molecular chaperone HscA